MSKFTYYGLNLEYRRNHLRNGGLVNFKSYQLLLFYAETRNFILDTRIGGSVSSNRRLMPAVFTCKLQSEPKVERKEGLARSLRTL